MVLLPPPAPGKQPLPFLAPDAVYAMCRYDVTVDSLAVTAAMAQAGWTLSLHTPQGDNFFVMPAQEARRGDVSLTVVPGAERLGEFVATPRRVSAKETQSPRRRRRASSSCARRSRGLAWRAETEALLRRATCTPVKRQQSTAAACRLLHPRETC